MRGLSSRTKQEIVTLFLRGLPYDEVARKLGISKGAVVNNIDDYREGKLVITGDMTECVDELRRVAVDLKKHQMTVSQVTDYVKIHAKLKEMGIGSEDLEQWIDICRDITSPTVSSRDFVNAALELAQLTSERNLGYSDLIADYDAKLNRSRKLASEIEQENKSLNTTRLQHRREREQATKELDSLTKAIATAQHNFSKQKDDLKSQLNEYLVQNRLSWKKVNTAAALFDTGLKESGLSKREIDQLSKRIRNTGVLSNAIKELEQGKSKLQSEVTRLAQEARNYTADVNELKEISGNLHNTISTNEHRFDELNAEVKSKQVEVEDLKQDTSQSTRTLYISRLIIDFLLLPNDLSNYDLDQLVSLMIALRQNRLGIEPKRVMDANGKVLCECQIPRVYGSIKMQGVDIDNVRTVFAHSLTPLLKDQFVSRIDYDMAEIKHLADMLKAIQDERNRHIF
ncbi:helix-turn-helix domain-containing protein [Chloroflexota bacterium]